MDSVWYWLVHISLLLLVAGSRFDAAVISIAIIVGIFSNLGTSSRSSFSAYSIFNKGCQFLLGEARPEAVDRELRGSGGVSREQLAQEASVFSSKLNIPSRFINRPCPCGSGLKAKKCHAQRASRAEELEGFEVVG